MMVVVQHFINWRWVESTKVQAANVIFNGSDAVSFFFVLSGFVLSYPYIHFDRKIKYSNYLKKRILRLYPAYIFNLILLFLYLNRKNLTGQTFYDAFILNQGTRIWNEIAMILNVHTLYFPGWTLRIEMIYSLLIIGLILIVTKSKKVWLIPILIGSFFIGEPRTRMCMTHFILGITFCIYYPKLLKIKFKETKFYKFRWLIYIIIFLLFSLRHFRLVPYLKEMFDYMWSKNIFWEHWSAIAAFLILVLLAMSHKMQKRLENKYLLFIGKISYSIYLIHWLLVQIVMDNWDKWINYIPNDALRFASIFSIYIGLVLLFATLMYKYIEVPFINLSKGKGLSLKGNKVE